MIVREDDFGSKPIFRMTKKNRQCLGVVLAIIMSCEILGARWSEGIENFLLVASGRTRVSQLSECR